MINLGMEPIDVEYLAPVAKAIGLRLDTLEIRVCLVPPLNPILVIDSSRETEWDPGHRDAILCRLHKTFGSRILNRSCLRYSSSIE